MTSEILEAHSTKSVETGQVSLSSQWLDLLKERHNLPALARPLSTDDSDFIVMKDPYGNGGVARPNDPIRHGDPYGNGGVARPDDPIRFGDPYGNGGVDRPEYHNMVYGKSSQSDGGGAGGHGAAHNDGTDTGASGGAHGAAHHDGTDNGAFDSKLQNVDVPGLTDEERDDAKSIGHAVLNGSEDDVRKIMEKYQNDPDGKAKVIDALNQSFESNGLSFSSDSNSNLTIDATPLHNQMSNEQPSITVISGNRFSSDEIEQRDAARWHAIQITMRGNMEHNSLDTPPTEPTELPPNTMY